LSDLGRIDYALPGAIDPLFVLTLILPGFIPATITAFARPLVMLGGRAPVDAFTLSAKRVMGAPRVFAVFVRSRRRVVHRIDVGALRRAYHPPLVGDLVAHSDVRGIL
jgi:hypothetical protein